MKFIHVADIHASRERLPQTLHILGKLTERAMQGDIDFILFAGDFWDSTITATKGSGFADIISAIRELERHTYLFFVYGTPTHEPNGSLDAFGSPKTSIVDELIGYYFNELNVNILFIPEPRRSNYVTSSAAETDKAINTEIYNKLTNTKKMNNAPMIVVYHGEVKGAVYQNGVSASSATAIPKELLQSLNADYYALGHIHMPQEVFPNAWYSGSACPKDFGEIHDGCYNLVTIDNGTTVERVSFNLPTYKTVQAKYSVTGLSYNTDGLENNHVRIQFSCTKEERKSLNIKQLQDSIKESAKAVSVKIEPEIIENESAKQSDVSKRKSVVEKMAEYAKEKSIKVPKYAEEILKNIQDNTLIKYAYPQHSFELLSLSLRGAIGIRNGQHKEDYELDFEKFDDGVVCLCGECGKGKCITGDSLILSENGFETIGSYDNQKKGFEKLVKNLYSEKNTSAYSSHFYSEEVLQTIKITNSLGMELEGTYNHPVLIFNENCEYQFKKLKDITTNDYICVPRNMNVFPLHHYKFSFKPFLWNTTKKTLVPTEMSPELAKFIGYYIANGSHTENIIQFSTKNEKIANDYIALAKKLFDVKVIKYCSAKSVPNYRSYSSVVRQFLEYIFDGKLVTGRYKIVPKCILQGTKEEQIAFITALFDCDGNLYKNVFEYTTASKQIAVALQNMLLNFGIVSSHHTKRVKNYNWDYHRLNIYSLGVDNLFYNILNKSLKYNFHRSKIANTNIDTIPYITQKILDLPRLKNGWIKSKNGKISMNPISRNFIQRNNELSYSKLYLIISSCYKSDIPEIIELNNLLRKLAKNFYFYSKIKKVEKLNKKTTVYDFTIPDGHRFYSNGYISHNTTLQENCHPYPCMLTRDGTLKDHFYLKDSHRILVYKDENGLYYKISMLIDGKTQSGKTSYFVETSKDRETWTSLPDVDGSLDSYKEWVNNTFGSIDIFLRTAFFAKEQTKNATDISDTTKGERMELLSKLAGTDHLKEVSVIAREQRKEIEKSAEKIESEIEIAADSESVIIRNMADIESWKESLNEINSHIKETEEKLSELRAKDAEFQKVKAMSESYKALYAQYEKSFNEIQREFYRFDDCVEHKETFDKVKNFKDKIETNASLIASKNTELPEKKARINELTSAVIKLTDEKVDIVRKITEINSQMTLCKSQISDTNGVCPTCGSPLSEHKKEELELHNKKMQEEFDTYSKEKEKAELLKAENLRKNIEIEKERDQLYDEVKAIEDSVAALENESRECEQFIASCDEIYSSYSYEDALEKANTLRAQAQELDKKMDDIIYEDNTEDVSKELAETEAELKLNTIKANNLTASVMAAEKENESCRKKLEAVSEKKGELKTLKDKIMAYNFIEDAFSNNGIPAIELRDSAPEISDIANKILKDSYGNRFEIRFGSTSELKAKRKANEDFNILVYDSENGDEKTIDLVSSGERIWIKQALFYAFSIVQMNRTGFNFRTRLIDESDGSLDGGLRPKYLQMVKSAHRYADSRITILISHSQEIKDICEQKIEL